ncbi:MAG: hypothetical protein KBT12_07730 [Bacteroidales bacterium]|nr:hypothetical protein [Candidatus Physcousia equi]
MQNDNLTLLYDLMRRDLRERGLDEQTINNRVGEAMQQRLLAGITPDTLSVGDVSNLSQHSLDLIANKMYNKQKLMGVKDTLLQLLRLAGSYLWKVLRFIYKTVLRVLQWAIRLNAEAKLGLVLLIPPFFGIVWYFLNTGIGAYYGDTEHPTMPVTPIYLGLMAIAGAYLVKGNLTSDDESKREEKEYDPKNN